MSLYDQGHTAVRIAELVGLCEFVGMCDLDQGTIV